MPRFNTLIWNYFEPSEDKIAKCKECNKELSYISTSHNLLQHLKLKHVNSYNDYNELYISNRKPKRNCGNLPKSNNLLIWNYFKQNPDKIADCKQCNKKLSYKSTIANLKKHLTHAHVDSYKEFVEQAVSVAAEDSSTSSEDHTSYFESGNNIPIHFHDVFLINSSSVFIKETLAEEMGNVKKTVILFQTGFFIT